MIIRTPEQQLNFYKNAMGVQLGQTFHHIRQELYQISGLWDQYETLFSLKERVKLLNDAGGFLAYNIQQTFFDQVMLGLCRITDPEKMGRRHNLSVKQFLALIDRSHKDELQHHIQVAIQCTEFCRDWRNRRIAHNDLEHKLTNALPLAPATRIQTTEAIKSVHRVINFIAGRYCETDMTLTQLGNEDAVQFLMYLFDGRIRQDEIRARERTGDFSDEKKYPDWLYDTMPFDERYRDD